MARLALVLAALLMALGGASPTVSEASGSASAERSAAAGKKRGAKKKPRRSCKVVKRGAKKKTVCKKAKKKKAQPQPKPPVSQPAFGAPGPAPPLAPPPPPGPGPDPAPSPSPPPPSDPPPTFDFKGPANPVDVDGTADATRAVSEYVDWQGGTIEATGADGTTYELTIPQGALVDETRITMTPLTKVDGLPFGGGLRAGVDLAPDGLRFVKPATLEISGASIDPALETGFAYHGDGQDLHLSPMVRDPHVHGFVVQHFSAYGIAHGTDAERRDLLVRRTESTERQLEQIVAQELQRDRQHQLGLPGGAPARLEVIEGAIEAYHDQVLEPLMKAALTDDGLVGRAINRYLLWERTVQLMLGDDIFPAKRDARANEFRQIILNASQRAYERCLAGNVGEIPVLISWERQIQLLELGHLVAPLHDRLRKCARFELDMESDVRQLHDTGQEEGPEDWHGHVTVTGLKLQFQDNWRVFGSGQFDYDEFKVTIPAHEPGTGCWQGGKEWERTGDWIVSDLHADFNWMEDADGDKYQLLSGDVTDWRLRTTPLITKEYVYWADCGGSTGTGGWTTWFGIVFGQLHQDTARPFEPIEFTGWTPAGPGVWKSVSKRTTTVEGDTTTEDTTLTLRHTPDPAA